ncbi:copper resistance CopC family protein [Zhihengliuella salsuginis]|uniref:CopC domain-containing protein n=1 Tax=Zhihengliuella salsuginis TaxID=578222 RepID=A0ABQ3GED6_9MICC|nr:copper resistance CopC family protein [Zhihengliuella salsuginis]GHD02490.1 hypothetical protein GCM10008096_07680 [Zhihengliuella salsuginis]
MISTRNTTRSTALAALFAALLLAVGAATAVSLASASTAHAHDQLISTDPADGAALEAPPEQLTLTFSGEIQDIGTTVELVDAEGAEHAVDLAADRGDLAITPQAALPAGDYTLSWRVTSSDGHPIEGTVDNGGAVEFSVAAGGDDAASASEATASEVPAEASESALNPDDPATSGPVELELDDSNAWVAPLVIIGLAVAAIAAVVVVIAKVRNQQK